MDVVVLGNHGSRPPPLVQLKVQHGQVFVRMHLDDGLEPTQLFGGSDERSIEGLLLAIGEEARHVLGEEHNDGSVGVEVEVPSDVPAQRRRRNQARGMGARIAHHGDAIGRDALLADDLFAKVVADDEEPARHVEELVVIEASQERPGHHQHRYALRLGGESEGPLGIPPVAGNHERRRPEMLQCPPCCLQDEERHEQIPLDGVAEQWRGQSMADRILGPGAGELVATGDASPQPAKDRPVSALENARLRLREVVRQVFGGDSGAAQAIQPGVQLGIVHGSGKHVRQSPGGAHGLHERIHDEMVARAAGDEDDARGVGALRRLAARALEEVANPELVVADLEQAPEARIGAGGHEPRRGHRHRHPAAFRDEPGRALEEGGSGNEHHLLGERLGHDLLGDTDRLRHLELEDDAAHQREEIRQPHAAVFQHRRRRGLGPEAVEEPLVAPLDLLRVDLEGLLVVEEHVDAGGQPRGVHEPAVGEDGQLMARGEDGCVLLHLTAVALDVASVERSHERLPELAITAGLLGDEKDAAHRMALGRAGDPITVTPAATSARTTAPAPTTASLPTVMPGSRTAPAPMKAPASTVTCPGRMTPGER